MCGCVRACVRVQPCAAPCTLCWCSHAGRTGYRQRRQWGAPGCLTDALISRLDGCSSAVSDGMSGASAVSSPAFSSRGRQAA